MDLIEFLINRIAIPLLLVATFFYCQINPGSFQMKLEKLLTRAPKFGKKNAEPKMNNQEFSEILTYGLKIRKIGLGWLTATVLLSVTLTIGLAFYYQMPLTGEHQFPIVFQLISSGFLAPIGEEFLVRGILLSYFVIGAIVLERRGIRGWSGFVIGLGLGLTTLAFTMAHGNQIQYQFISRFLTGLFCGLLYLVSGRNLLPPIIAHATGNLTIIIGSYLMRSQ